MTRLRASITVRVPADLRLALRDRARTERTTVAGLCRRALRAELDRGTMQPSLPFAACQHERTYMVDRVAVCLFCGSRAEQPERSALSA